MLRKPKKRLVREKRLGRRYISPYLLFDLHGSTSAMTLSPARTFWPTPALIVIPGGNVDLDPGTEIHETDLLPAGDPVARPDEAFDPAGGDADDLLHGNGEPSPRGGAGSWTR